MVTGDRCEHEKDFDPVAYAEEVMKKVGADFHEDDPLFQTNEFRMHCYKILPCTKHFCHDWSVCPFAHFSERAKRRDPKDVKYTAIACPDMKKGEDCPRGDRCPYSHNTFEYWLHPTRYRTRMCRDNEACNRKICFFAHRPDEVRNPTSRPSLPISEEPWTNDMVKEEKETDTAPSTDTVALDPVSQFHALLQGGHLNVSTTGNEQPTFVDQVLNGMLPSSGVPSLPLTDSLQMAQAAQNLSSFDSCFQTQGLSQGGLNSIMNGGFPMYDGFQGIGSFNAFTQPMPFGSMGLPDLSLQFNGPPLVTKTQPDLNEVIQLLSNMQMATSPTSVLPQGSLSHGLGHSAFSNDGLGDELDQMAFHLNGTGPTAGTLFRMNL